MAETDTPHPETLYSLVDRLGPVEVARVLGEHYSTIARARAADTDVSTKLLGKCMAVWGDRFDSEGSALEWYRARASRPVKPGKIESDANA